MLFCVEEMSGYELWECTSEEWTDAVDRGGLHHINDSTFLCFYLMELVIRQQLLTLNLSHLNDSTQSQIMSAMVSNEILQSLWKSTITIEDENSATLFKMISELYLTIRGFAFAKSCLELYKRREKRQLGKSKGIRKDLFTSKTKDKS